MSNIPLSDRIYDYKTIYNFRDFGGYQGEEGRLLKQKRLFRSAHLNKLNDEEVKSIGDLNVGLIVDLRHAPERRRQPSRSLSPKPVTYEFPDPPETRNKAVAPHEAFLQNDLETAQDSYNYMMGSYGARPDDPGFRAIFKDTLQYMISGSDPKGILVHCAAGKDRTGTLVALIQGLLGMSRDDIITDYMLTLEAVDIEAMLEPAAKMFSDRYERQISPEALRPMFGVSPDYLLAALETMGNMDDYTQKKLGIKSGDIAKLKSLYLE